MELDLIVIKSKCKTFEKNKWERTYFKNTIYLVYVFKCSKFFFLVTFYYCRQC